MEESQNRSDCFGREGEVLCGKWNIKKSAKYLQRMWKAVKSEGSRLLSAWALTAGGSAEQNLSPGGCLH